jgi:hypothetical protein
MTNASKIDIKNRLKDLKETTFKQAYQFQKELDSKKKRFHDVFEKSNSNEKSDTNPVSAMAGLLAFLKIIEIYKKSKALQQLKESFQANEELRKKEQLVEKLYTQVVERLDIIEKAETNDLQDFIKDNDIYAVFEKDKLEEYMNDNEKSDSKENEIKKEKYQAQEVDHAR